MSPKYSVQETGPRIEQFLSGMIASAGFELSFRLEPGEQKNPEFENPDLMVKFAGADVDLLLSNRAELLLALELVTQEMLRMHSDDHSRVAFDANDYRALRIEELRVSALAAAEKVKHTGTYFRFNAMNSRERRMIHIALRHEPEVRSESCGMGAQRGVVIYPASMASIPDLPPLPNPNRPPPASSGEGRDRDRGRRPERGGRRPMRPRR